MFYRVSASDWAAGGWDVAQSVELARRLKDGGASTSSTARAAATWPTRRWRSGPATRCPSPSAIRRQAGIPVSAVGLISDAVQAEQIVFLGQADAVCLARAMLRDPYWPRHAARELKVEMAWPDQYKRCEVGPLGR